MKQQRIILITVFFLTSIFNGPTLSQMPPRLPLIIEPDMTEEEEKEAMLNWIEERNRPQQEKEQRTLAHLEHELMGVMKRLLMASDRQWRLIEPQFKKMKAVSWRTWLGAQSWGKVNKMPFRFKKYENSDSELNDAQIIVNELIDLLKDTNSTDTQIRQKMDALQEDREKARKQLLHERQELRKLLACPRQEAMFMILGYLD